MIDIYAAVGPSADIQKLAADAASLVKTIEQVPDIPMFRQNTAAFVHELPAVRSVTSMKSIGFGNVSVTFAKPASMGWETLASCAHGD